MKKSLNKVKKSLKTHNKKQKKIVRRVEKRTNQRKQMKIKVKSKAKSIVKVKAKTRSAVSQQKINKIVKKSMSTKKPVLKKSTASFGPVDVKSYQAGKNEEYMNNVQLEHFRVILLQWKSQLMAEVDRTVHHMRDDASNYPDPVDRASQEEEFSLELRTRDRERKLLRKIEETLNRIDKNDYGYCDDCGAEIGIKRLEVRPTATQCIECKNIAEIREKQVGDGV